MEWKKRFNFEIFNFRLVFYPVWSVSSRAIQIENCNSKPLGPWPILLLVILARPAPSSNRAPFHPLFVFLAAAFRKLLSKLFGLWVILPVMDQICEIWSWMLVSLRQWRSLLCLSIIQAFPSCKTFHGQCWIYADTRYIVQNKSNHTSVFHRAHRPRSKT